MQLFETSRKTTLAEDIREWRYNQLISHRVESLVRESADAKNILRASTNVA